MNYILSMLYDEDYDNAVDGFGVKVDYKVFDSEQEVLAYLQRDIYYEGGKTKPHHDTVKGYCEQFPFHLYERKY
jgi:hypothetical protein